MCSIVRDLGGKVRLRLRSAQNDMGEAQMPMAKAS